MAKNPKNDKFQIRETYVLQPIVIQRINKILDESKLENFNYDKEEQRFKSKFSESFENILRRKTKNLRTMCHPKINIVEKQKKIKSLPVFKHKNEILNKISNATFTLISGDTGCGKSTQIPQFILDHFIENGRSAECNLICTQPRRISAIAVAERVARERNETIGKSVGYQIRLEKCMPDLSKSGKILYCTTGVLLRKMETDPLLAKISHIILDEIHERSVELDLLIGLLKIVVQYNKNLKIILMSATFGIDEFCEYFDGCPIIRIEGKMYPVEVKYLEDILEIIPFEFKNPINGKYTKNEEKEFKQLIEPYVQDLHKSGKYSYQVINNIKQQNSEGVNLLFIKALIFYIANNQPEGAILTFLPSYAKIDDLFHILTKSPEYNKAKYKIYTLHSLIPIEKQRGIFRRPNKGVRKIILSTTIAETSITIGDVVYVINPGRIKVNDYDIQNIYDVLEETWITEAHSKQRQGRAGRCQPGICYNLYTRARETTFAKYAVPEIQRTRLEPVILRLKFMCIKNIPNFLNTLLNCPNMRTLDNGFQLLKRINALDPDEHITPLGSHMARLPLDPQLAKMLVISSIFECVEPITSICATLSYKEPFYVPIKHGGNDNIKLKDIKLEFSNDTYSDELLYANVIKEYDLAKTDHTIRIRNYERENFISNSNINQLKELKCQLYEILRSAGFINHSSNINSDKDNLLKSIIAAGLYPNIAYIKEVKQVKKKIIQTIVTPEDNKNVILHKWSVNQNRAEFDSKFLVYCNKRKGRKDICLYDSTMVFADSLIIFADKFQAIDNNGEYIFKILDNIEILTNYETFEIIKILRHRFEMLLQKLALGNKKSTADENLIKALILLFTCDLD